MDTTKIPAAVILLLLIIGLILLCKRNAGKRRGATDPVCDYWCADLKNGLKPSAESPNGKVYDWKLKETWEDYPFPDYDTYHTYCSVAFEASGKTFYYRTRNPELKVGDMVYVPVGYQYEKKVGRIVKMEKYLGHQIPYPLGKTKYIIGKVKQEVQK